MHDGWQRAPAFKLLGGILNVNSCLRGQKGILTSFHFYLFIASQISAGKRIHFSFFQAIHLFSAPTQVAARHISQRILGFVSNCINLDNRYVLIRSLGQRVSQCVETCGADKVI